MLEKVLVRVVSERPRRVCSRAARGPVFPDSSRPSTREHNAAGCCLIPTAPTFHSPRNSSPPSSSPYFPPPSLSSWLLCARRTQRSGEAAFPLFRIRRLTSSLEIVVGVCAASASLHRIVRARALIFLKKCRGTFNEYSDREKTGKSERGREREKEDIAPRGILNIVSNVKD